ncbi:10455_t:CDS:1, partial [Cetraspora pellucida]
IKNQEDENIKENKFIPSFNYDMTKGVIIGLATSLMLNYLNGERISMIVENVTNFLKEKKNLHNIKESENE